MTHGDKTKCKCPGCKKWIYNPIGSLQVTSPAAVEGTIKCPSCGKDVHYWAQLSVTVDLELESKTF